ncbi:MAG TPA: DUF6489 family protein [Candidatus Competibacteraceae bacterium]|nr:DUF6489 family protein [Candidatus Competibacteraceae bacterium]
MKIHITVEASAQEMREFLGLPNIQPLQEEILEQLRENLHKGMAGFDPQSLLKPLLTPQLQTVEQWQKLFWDAFTQQKTESEE